MSSILGGSYCPSIHGGTFNTITTYRGTGLTGFERLMQAVSPNAFHNSDDRPDPPKCHPNTRVTVIKKIMEWVTGGMDTDTFILWLYGPAGAGKTAIARSVADLCAKHGLLLASFLFFRSDSNRNIMKPVVANIAYCVARVIPHARESIEAIIEDDPFILLSSVEEQLTKLVLEPLRLLTNQGYFLHRRFPPLVVIDGLDECLDKVVQTNLIGFLSSSLTRYQIPLKFFIVSRPEAHIKWAVTLAGEETTISRLDLNKDFLPDEDIRRFLTDKLHEIKKCHLFRSRIPSFWPSKQQIEALVCKASGQFIYASLAVRFISSACDSPIRRLDIILELQPPIEHDLPFAELDSLYTSILSCTKNLHLVLRILGVNNALNRTDDISDTRTIESVLGLEGGDVHVYLSPLSSLLEAQESYVDYAIIFHHSSFMHFLRTPERSKSFYLDDGISHTLIAQWVLGAFTSDVPGESGRKKDLWLPYVDLVSHLTHSSWTFELERALENFSLGPFLDIHEASQYENRDTLAEKFFDNLEAKEKPKLHRHHSALYLEHALSAINKHRSGEKFHLLSTVWFVLRERFTSQQIGARLAKWHVLCATLFGFDSSDIRWDSKHYDLMRDPTEYGGAVAPLGAIYGYVAETKRHVPEPILSHRLSCVAISCLRYLQRRDSDTPPTRDHFCTWEMKSKQSPWLWRRRMRVTSRRRQLDLEDPEPIYSFPPSLRGSRQILCSKGIQSEKFYQVQCTLYIWTLDILYYTLRKARKSDELIKALSQPFIPLSASFLFPCRIKRVRKAVDSYLEKVGEPV